MCINSLIAVWNIGLKICLSFPLNSIELPPRIQIPKCGIWIFFEICIIKLEDSTDLLQDQFQNVLNICPQQQGKHNFL